MGLSVYSSVSGQYILSESAKTLKRQITKFSYILAHSLSILGLHKICVRWLRFAGPLKRPMRKFRAHTIYAVFYSPPRVSMDSSWTPHSPHGVLMDFV